jgi:hypothetical protein
MLSVLAIYDITFSPTVLFGCQLWSLTPTEHKLWSLTVTEHKFQVCGNTENVFVYKEEDVRKK